MNYGTKRGAEEEAEGGIGFLHCKAGISGLLFPFLLSASSWVEWSGAEACPPVALPSPPRLVESTADQPSAAVDFPPQIKQGAVAFLKLQLGGWPVVALESWGVFLLNQWNFVQRTGQHSDLCATPERQTLS
jgi:hypothetical protein